MKRVTSHFLFLCAAFLPCPLQPAEPLKLRVWSLFEAWHRQGTIQWTWKAQQTPGRTLFLLCVCLSLTLILLFWSKRLDNTKPTVHSLQPPCLSTSLLNHPIHFHNGEEESASARLSAAPTPPSVFEGSNQSLYLSNFVGMPLLKRRRTKGQCLNNESVQGMNCSSSVCLSFWEFSSDVLGSDHRFNEILKEWQSKLSI